MLSDQTSPLPERSLTFPESAPASPWHKPCAPGQQLLEALLYLFILPRGTFPANSYWPSRLCPHSPKTELVLLSSLLHTYLLPASRHMTPSFLVSPPAWALWHKEQTKMTRASEWELSAGIGPGAAFVGGGRGWSRDCRTGTAALRVKKALTCMETLSSQG